MRDPITVDFSIAEEFCAELQTHDPVAWDTVRLTLRVQAVNEIVRNVTVVATAVVAAGGILLRLRQYVGEYMGLAADRTTDARAKAAMTLVEQTAVRRGLKVRPGVYSLPGADA